MRTLRAAAPLTFLALVAAFQAKADTIDLTVAGASGTLGGAIYTQTSINSGTGNFPAFVQISPGGSGKTEQGYNTTQNGIFDNGSSAVHNHEIALSQVPIVTVNGIAYYQFMGDINEDNGQGGGLQDSFLSLDRFQLYTSTTPNSNTTTIDPAGHLPGLGTLRYDSGAGNEVLLDFNLQSGSGYSDLSVLVPISDFAGALGSDYVYLYSSYGAFGIQGTRDYRASDGFEEWALGFNGVVSSCPNGNPPPCNLQEVPEPSSLAAIGGSLVLFGVLARRRRWI